MVRRKRIVACCLFGLMIVSFVGAGSVGIARANFYSMFLFNFNITPVTDKPSITLLSPINGTANSSIMFDVVMPKSWLWNGSGYYVFVGQISKVECYVDQELVFSDSTTYGLETFFENNPNPFKTIINCDVNYSLASGAHVIGISVVAHTCYNYKNNLWYDVSTDVSFVCKPNVPIIDNLSIKNETYSTSFLPLVYYINESTSWQGLSLDNQANVTIDGNVTLTGLREGNHSLIVYANDTFGNMGASDTTSFSIVLPTPSPSPTPSPAISPTLQPTL